MTSSAADDSLHDAPGRARDDDAANDHRPEFTVVGIGASAGGLSALRSLFEHLPDDPGLAFVVVVHLSPDRQSHLADLLQPASRLPVTQVNEAVPIEPNHVYVIPPGRNLSAIDTHLRLSEIEEQRILRAPIDHFLRTLATTHHEHAVAVILTGTGSDGALGLREIKAGGGLTIIQDPNEAEYDGMPQSALATGAVDLVLRVAEIPAELLRYARTAPQVDVGDDDGDLPDAVDRALERIFQLVRTRTGRDFSRYKRSTTLRRIVRRARLHGVPSLEAYFEMLREQVDEVTRLGDELLITVTNFFRDPELFAALETTVIPDLFAGRTGDDVIRVWSAGCSTGEEAYSLAMLLIEEAGRHEAPPQIQIFASDLHERSLRSAREGYYPETISSDVSPERLRRFFVRESGGFRIRKEVREAIVFAPHNLLADPPFSKLDLVSCRNVLIYLDRAVQRDVLELFHYALKPGGYLVLGSSESLDRPELFVTLDKRNCIHQRRNVKSPDAQLPVFRFSGVPRSHAASDPAVFPASYGALHQRLVERYAPPSILVGPEQRVFHLSERAGRYLSVPGGEPTSNVLRLVRDELKSELQAALQAARQQKAAIWTPPVVLELDGAQRQVVVHVQPALEGENQDLLLLVFEERAAPRDDGIPAAAEDAAEAQGWKAELDRTQKRLRDAVEDYQSSQEDMRAANEELQSANEELRSTMEELETSKEELQSMNEELSTVNQENKHKVEELAQLSSDLQHLIASTDIATLFLDRNLRILRFTPRASGLFNVRGSDRGRPLADLTHRLGYDGLLEDARRVLEHLVPVERELQDESGRWYLTRVSPYRSKEDRIAGVVMTFVDISARKAAEIELLRVRDSLSIAVEAADLGTWELDLATDTSDRRSARHDQIYGYPGLQPSWSRAIARQHVVPDDRALFDAAFEEALTSGNLRVEFRVLWPDGSVRWVQLLGRTFYGESGKPEWMAGVNADITERKLQGAAQQFLLDLDSALQPVTSAQQVAGTVVEALGRQLDASECVLAECRDDTGWSVLAGTGGDRAGAESPGVPDAARRAFFDFACRRGSHAVDNATLDLEPAATAVDPQQLGLGAYVAAVLREDGDGCALLLVRCDRPRTWRVDEQGLVHDALRRSWIRLRQARTGEALRESKALLELSVEAAGVGTWVYEVPTGTIRWSDQARRMSGTPDDGDATLTGFLALVHPDDRAGVRDALDAALEPGGTGMFRAQFRFVVDSDVRWIESRGRTFFDDRLDGRRAERIVGAMVDVTEIRGTAEVLEQRVRERTRQVRKLAAHLTMTAEEERRRIAAVLHDDMQQVLYGAEMKLGATRHMLQEAGHAEAEQGLQEARGLLMQAVETARSLAVDLSPPVFTDEGLRDALDWLGRQMEELHGLHVSVRADGPFVVADEDLRVLLFQVIRELLFNVTKHAGVDRATVELRADGEERLIRVTDEGVGFAASASAGPGRRGSTGLHNAKERLQLLGGDLQVDSSPGRGTRAEIRVPSPAADGGEP